MTCPTCERLPEGVHDFRLPMCEWCRAAQAVADEEISRAWSLEGESFFRNKLRTVAVRIALRLSHARPEQGGEGVQP